MKIILNAPDGASVLDLMPMLRCANYAVENGPDAKPGSVMAVTVGEDLRSTYGVVRTKTGVSVWPPAVRTHPETPATRETE